MLTKWLPWSQLPQKLALNVMAWMLKQSKLLTLKKCLVLKLLRNLTHTSMQPLISLKIVIKWPKPAKQLLLRINLTQPTRLRN
ncbi:JK_29P [Escherichia phage Jk06]|uniref:JK_29P n=1 Tax=Escherichia phage Jk06 TaxID=2886922 RepID=Q45PY6_9CAUD|nr:hypothetical protein JK_29 [Escherichia phage Jk06]AAZ29279.1 JK_29P [Escherichia phage Jk06]